jgi:NitT/TauT family transport system substrate-binding protein
MTTLAKVMAGLTVCGLALAQWPGAACAEVQELRLAKQFSMGYVQFNILDHRQLIEKHAKALGLPDIKVSWATFNGPNAMNDALIAGSIDIVAGGVPGLATLWARTRARRRRSAGSRR